MEGVLTQDALAGALSVGDVNVDGHDDFLVHGLTASYILLGPVLLSSVHDVDEAAAILIDPALGTPAERHGDIDGDGVGDLLFLDGDEITIILGGVYMPRTLSATSVDSTRLRTIALPGGFPLDGLQGLRPQLERRYELANRSCPTTMC